MFDSFSPSLERITAMTRETVLWKSIRTLPFPHAERLETRSVGAGFPDTHLIFPNDESWFVELKHGWIVRGAPAGPSPLMLTRVRASQIRWHTLFALACRRSAFLLVIQGGGRYAVGSRFASLLARGSLPVSKAIEISDADWSISGLYDALRRASDASVDSAEDSACVRTFVDQAHRV
jgi:hypothetical protein